MNDFYGSIIMLAVFILWGTVGALECNAIGFGQFWIQTFICSWIIWLCIRTLLKQRRR